MRSSYPNSAVAVVGMACRLPGAPNLDAFWQLVRSGRSAWGPVSPERFDRRLYYNAKPGIINKSYSDLAALVDYQEVDRRVCPISESAMANHDLAHVTLCEVAAQACRHAGLDPAALPFSNTGVYIGHAAASGLATELVGGTYIAQTARYLKESVGVEQLADGITDQVIDELIQEVRGNCPRFDSQGPLLGASLAARLIAQTFGISGPCMSFNAACASSSRAALQAIQALQLDEIEMALVGGASFFHSDTLVLFSQSRSLSAKGSNPFSAEADGLVVGEGYVVLMLERLDRAVAQQRHILAVLPSVGTSSDGRGKSLWAPRMEGQILAIQRAYNEHIRPGELQYVEAHATSTSLGDITEMKALTTVFADHLPPGAKVPVGSAKLNVGHTLESAGLVGVAKAILALQHEVVPPAIDQRPLNPQIDWDNIPFYAPRQATSWPRRQDGRPRRAAVDAFGIGGLNVHVVVDEYVASTAPTVAGVSLPAQKSATSSRREDDAVAIVGMGAVMPGAMTLNAFWDLLRSGRSAITEVTDDRWEAQVFHRPDRQEPWSTPTKSGGFVTGFEYDWRTHKIPPREIAHASPLQFMILDSVDQALHQSKYNEREFDRQRVGVVVGTMFGGECAVQLVMGLRLPIVQDKLARLLQQKGVPPQLVAQVTKSYGNALLKHMPAILDETGSFTASALASRITKSFNLMGSAVAVDAGRASSLAALSCCVNQLRSGDCDMMVCTGGQHDMTLMIFDVLKIADNLGSDVPISPFDVRAHGLLPGEGCGTLLLKRLADARRDHDPIYGIIRGIGAAGDTSSTRAAELAAKRALQDAELLPSQVAVLEATPVGVTDEDTATLNGILEAYRDDQQPRSKPLLMGTTIGQMGDTGGGLGMASILKSVMEVEHQLVPADFGLSQPAPYVTEHPSLVQVPLQDATVTANSDGRVIAAVHSGGHHEINYHVLLERGTKLTSTDSNAKPSSTSAAETGAAPQGGGRIVHFDATTRRRDKLRQQATTTGSETASQGAPGDNGSSRSGVDHAASPNATAPPSAPVRSTTLPPFTAPVRHNEARMANPAPATPPSAAQSQAIPAPAAPFAPAPAPPPAAPVPTAAAAPTPPAPAPTQPAPPSPAVSTTERAAQLDAGELETFLVNFVVEHTGYPAEIVELDVDLEADLGIDSIKKAQLFGELGEYFDVQPSEDLSLDDFPTLRHVLDFLVKSEAVSTAASSSPAVNAESTPAAPPAPPSATTAPPAAQVPPAAPADTSAENATMLDPHELETFLVNFVVEHTGYPAEIVELDVDLEADLGIDSIKKAQLFGELGEYFDVQPSEDLSLDDFPTLRHVLDFLLQAQVGSSEAAPPTPVSEAPAPPTPSAAPLPPAPDPMPSAAAPPAQPVQAAPTGPTLNSSELESFLVNFVVEHTGYPAEIVELDVDLEADLGIDSIKKAQLFGELGEYFDVQPSEDLSLDDFPTLRHVLDFLVQAQSGQPANAAATAVTPTPGTAAAPASAPVAPVPAPPPVAPASVAPPVPPLPPAPASAVQPVASPTAPAAPAAPAESTGAMGQLDAQELESFLVNFVVEHTGYPPEIVELDVDLEADLGIDSIKKGELFGELGEYFDVQPSEDLSLDDFPTLRHVLNFLLQAQGSP